MQAVAEEALEFQPLLLVAQAVQVAQGVAVTAGTLLPHKMELPTQGVAQAVARFPANPAAPASSSLNTKFRLHLPLSSHQRETGLHRLVRSALTTSLLLVVAAAVPQIIPTAQEAVAVQVDFARELGLL